MAAVGRLEDQPARLGTLLNRIFTFQRCLDFAFGGYGNGIAAPVVGESTHHILPSGKEQRGALELRLRGVGGLAAVTVFCTHWGLDASERKLQAEALARLVNAARRPVVVCGDLNESPTGDAVRALLERASLIDAKFEVSSRPGSTCVRLDLRPEVGPSSQGQLAG